MRRLVLLFVLIACFLSLQAQEKPEKLKGLLWEISGNGIAHPGYLYGTMHVSEKLVFNLSDSFFIALHNVDVVALETNHDDWQAFMDNIVSNGEDNPFGGMGGNYRDNNKNLYNEAFRFTAPTRDLLGAMLSVKPVMTNEFLYRSNDYQQDYEEDTYLDLFIFQAGKKLGKKVIGLESLEGSYESVTRARIPDDENERRRDRYNGGGGISLEEAYRDQDLHLIDSINQMSSPGKNFQRYMLDERNLVMAHGIDSILRSGTPIFSAVGAAHLPGETGVIKLLRKMGYSLRPVQFTNKAGTSDKEQIDKMRYPVQISRHWLADSTWSTESPGRFYPTYNAQGFEQHLSADMSNGVFYAVYRLKTFGWWSGQTPAYIADRLDSLIYERIPGKIYDRKRITAPFPGHEVSTRTRRGDVQRFKIFVTPSEIVMFTIGGNGDYALGEEANRFLNNIRFTAQKENTPTHTLLEPKFGGYRVDFPTALSANSIEDADAQQYLALGIDPSDGASYFLYRTDYHDLDYIEEDTFELNIIGEKIAEQFTKRAPQMRLVSTEPYPTQDISFQAENDSAWHFLRLVIDGPHYYLLGCRKKSPAAPTQFFESFVIEPNKYPVGLSSINDTIGHYRVTALNEPDKPAKAFINRLRAIYKEGERKRSTLMGYEDEYSFSTGEDRSTIRSPLSGEEISLRIYESRSGGSLPSIDSFKMNVRRALTQRNKMAVKESSWEEWGGMLIGNFLLSDTNSTRGIRTKLFIINKKTYTLAATVNLKAPQSAFLRSVFDSFTPSDSLDGSSLFGKRNLDFLKDIYSTDTLKREIAMAQLKKPWRMGFEGIAEKDLPMLKAVIGNPGFPKLKFKERQNLIKTLGDIPCEESVQYLHDFYLTYPDSARYRETVLQTLAAMKYRSAYQLLLDLWLKEPVFVNTNNGDIFSSFNDTLELTATMLPQLLELTNLDATRDQMLYLLEKMAEQGLLKSKTYSKLKPMLVRETSWLISKHQYDAEAERDKQLSGYDDYYNENEQAVGEPVIARNLHLLAPFLSKDDEVKSLMERILRYGSDPLKIIVYGLYLENDIPVPADRLKPFTDNDKTRFPLYKQLAEAGKLGEYSAWFRDTTALLESYLIASKSSPYAARDIDSIKFHSRYNYTLFNKPAFIYFFDIKQKDDKQWGLAQVVVPQTLILFNDSKHKTHAPKTGKSVYYTMAQDAWGLPQVRVMSNMTGKEKEDYIKKKIAEIRFVNRERYRSQVDGRYYYPGLE